MCNWWQSTNFYTSKKLNLAFLCIIDLYCIQSGSEETNYTAVKFCISFPRWISFNGCLKTANQWIMFSLWKMLFQLNVGGEKEKKITAWKRSFYPYVTKFILQRCRLGGLLHKKFIQARTENSRYNWWDPREVGDPEDLFNKYFLSTSESPAPSWHWGISVHTSDSSPGPREAHDLLEEGI